MPKQHTITASTSASTSSSTRLSRSTSRRRAESDASPSPSDRGGNPPPSPGLENFAQRTYEWVRRVPEGNVASYGDIAKYLGRPQNSRLVGQTLKYLPRHLATPYLLPPPASPPSSSGAGSDDDSVAPAPLPNPDFVPWHRIVSSSGVIPPRSSGRAAAIRQADYLEAEGVEVTTGARGAGVGGRGGHEAGLEGIDGRVSMARYRWKGPTA